MSRFFTSGGQSIGASASTSVFPVNIQDSQGAPNCTGITVPASALFQWPHEIPSSWPLLMWGAPWPPHQRLQPPLPPQPCVRHAGPSGCVTQGEATAAGWGPRIMTYLRDRGTESSRWLQMAACSQTPKARLKHTEDRQAETPDRPKQVPNTPSNADSSLPVPTSD